MIDFAAIASQGTLYNFHCHTQFCDGKAPMQQFVEQALEQGFTHLGFTPHSPIPVDSPCNMSRDNVPTYLSEVARLQQLAGNRLVLYAGMEVDYMGPDWGPSNAYFDTLNLDYRIGSVHFIPSLVQPGVMVDVDGSPDGFAKKMQPWFDGDIEWVVRKFYDQSIAMVEAGGFHIAGHFDKIGYNANTYRPGITQEKWYEQLVRRQLDAIMDHHLVVEINTKAWERAQRFFPHAQYFSLLKRYGTPVVFNSDSHVPALLNAGRQEAIEQYRKA